VRHFASSGKKPEHPAYPARVFFIFNPLEAPDPFLHLRRGPVIEALQIADELRIILVPMTAHEVLNGIGLTHRLHPSRFIDEGLLAQSIFAEVGMADHIDDIFRDSVYLASGKLRLFDLLPAVENPAQVRAL
jgi:hypothetical protein